MRQNRRYRILMITRNFPPMTGGMERVSYHAYLELRKYFDVTLLAPRGSERCVSDRPPVALCSNRPLPAFLACLQWKARRSAIEFAPDLVIASSGISALAAYGAARVAKARVICCVHGLDLVAPSMVYQKLFVPAIRRSDAVIANSRNTADLAHRAGVALSRLSVLHPGVAAPAGTRPQDKGAFRARYGLKDQKLLLSVGRLLPRKGLPDFIRRVMPVLVARRNDITLAIIGEEPNKALAAASGEARRIRDAIKVAGVSRNVMMLGAVSDAILYQAYAASDLMIFPVRDMPGDVEGFGMVALEAAAHGLATAAFSSGGVGDAVRDAVSGYLIDPGNFDVFAQVILHHLESGDREMWRDRCIEFANTFSWDRYGTELCKICVDTIEAE